MSSTGTDKPQSRGIIALNVANRVACYVQQIVERDKYSARFTTFHSVSITPAPSYELLLDCENGKRVMHRWDIQMLLDLREGWQAPIERKVLSMMQEVFAGDDPNE